MLQPPTLVVPTPTTFYTLTSNVGDRRASADDIYACQTSSWPPSRLSHLSLPFLSGDPRRLRLRMSRCVCTARHEHAEVSHGHGHGNWPRSTSHEKATILALFDADRPSHGQV